MVSGAPRANHSGAVLLLKKGPDTSGKLLIEHTLYGPGLASAFGYDVTVVDLNGDGYRDLRPMEKFPDFVLIFEEFRPSLLLSLSPFHSPGGRT